MELKFQFQNYFFSSILVSAWLGVTVFIFFQCATWHLARFRIWEKYLKTSQVSSTRSIYIYQQVYQVYWSTRFTSLRVAGLGLVVFLILEYRVSYKLYINKRRSIPRTEQVVCMIIPSSYCIRRQYIPWYTSQQFYTRYLKLIETDTIDMQLIGKES